MKRLIAFLAVGVLAAVGLRADEPQTWSRFRGANGSGVAEGQKPPVEFGPAKNVRWKIPVPSGLSSPIVAGGNLILTAFEGGKLYTIAYRRADGKEAWRALAPAKRIEPYYKAEGSPAVPTCATDGQRIVSYFGSYGLLCYNLAGKRLWKFEIPMTAMPGDFGTGTSPIVAGGAVVLVRDEAKNPRIIALDAATGLLRWQKKRQSPVSYSTPVVWDTPTGKQVVTVGHGRMVSYDLKTGAEIWSVASMPSGPCSSPVASGDALLFAGWTPGGAGDPEFQMPVFDALLKDMDKNKDGSLTRSEAVGDFGGFFDSQDMNKDGKITREEYDILLKFMSEGKNTAFAVKPGGTGDVTDSHMLWKKTKGLPYIASAILYRGQYVMVRDGGIVTALDAKTGDELYMERVAAPGSYYASPVAANGHIYFTSLVGGIVTVLTAGSDKPVVAAKNPKLGERVAATPAIADNTLYVRTDKLLYAFSETR